MALPDRNIEVIAAEPAPVKLVVVYTNQTSKVKEMINLFNKILSKQAEIMKTNKQQKLVVGFDLEYTMPRKGEIQTVAVAQLCVKNHVLVYHYHWAAPSPSKRFANFINNDAYDFAAVDTNNDARVLRDTGLMCQNLVDIQEKYKIKNNNKSNDSLADLAAAIIDPSFISVKGKANQTRLANKWTDFPLDDDQVAYAAKDAYVGYEVYRRIVLMRECLLNPEDVASRSSKKKKKKRQNN